LSIPYFSHEHIFQFLIQMLVLLGLARCMGEVMKRWGSPALVGEILTGLILGPTILGRFWAQGHRALFPGTISRSMLETISWLGVLFMLLTIGFEVNISTVWRQGKACLKIGIIGVLVPIILGVVVFWWLPEAYHGDKGSRLSFALIMATAAAISAIPIIARVLHDLEILKTDFGLTTLSAFIVNDILGWLLFAVLLAFFGSAGDHNISMARVIFEIVLFAAAALTFGSKLVGYIVKWFHDQHLPEPATTLTFIFGLGLLCGAITNWIGVHAILGFFLAGVMVGNAKEISEHARETISQVVHAIFIPIFFASIGLHIDIWEHFDLIIVIVFTAVALGGKFIGAAAGAWWARTPKNEILSTGFAHIPGGAIEIIIGVLALESRIISKSSFVAVIFAAVSSSLLVGPLVAWSMRRQGSVAVRDYLVRDAFALNLLGQSRWDVIEELCSRVAETVRGVKRDELLEAVREREELMGTALDGGIAIPHARMNSVSTPVIAFGRSKQGVEWDARDGHPTHLAFLILVPESAAEIQVQILGSLARALMDDDLHDRLMAADNRAAAHRLLDQALYKHEMQTAVQTAGA
jgi:K+:H+ antiporter